MENIEQTHSSEVLTNPIVPCDELKFDFVIEKDNNAYHFPLTAKITKIKIYNLKLNSLISYYEIYMSMVSDIPRIASWSEFVLKISHRQVYFDNALTAAVLSQLNAFFRIHLQKMIFHIQPAQTNDELRLIIQNNIAFRHNIQITRRPGFSVNEFNFKREYMCPLNRFERSELEKDASIVLKNIFYMESMGQVTRNYFQLLERLSFIENPDKRRFIFLYYHLCYMASLLSGSVNGRTVIIDTDISIEGYLIEYLFVGQHGYGAEQIDIHETERNILLTYRDTKDIPFILRANDSVSARKCESLLKELSRLKELPDVIFCEDFYAVPIVFSTQANCCDNLFHLSIYKEDVRLPFTIDGKKMDFRIYFESICNQINKCMYPHGNTEESFYINRFSHRYNIEKQKSDINNEPSIYAAFRTLNWFLKKYYDEIGAKTHHNEEFDVLFKEDINSFLARFMPTLKLSHSIRKDQFYGTVRNLISEQRLSVFSREKYDLSECASREEFENMPCLLYSKESWAFNDHAVSLIAGATPEPCSKQRLVNMLNEKGILTNRRINRDSYQNRLRVYFRNGDRDDLELYETRSEDGIIHNDENDYSFESVKDGLYFHLGKKADSDKDMYWDFDNGKNLNQHMLITGQSGSGKSCFLQNLISQSANQRITTVVFHQQGIIPYCDNAEVVDIYKLKAGLKCFEDDNLDSTKIADRITSALRLTRNQRDIIDENYEIYLDERTKRTNNALCSVGDFIELVLSDKNAFPGITSSILRKLKTLKDLSSSPDDFIDWSEYEGKTVILDFSGNNSDSVWYECFTELYMQDLFLYRQKRFAEAVGVSPMIIVCDEFQNMNMNPNAAMDRILREGRKYGIALWMASQLVQSSQVSRIKQITDQSAMKIYFQTGTERGRKIANILGRTAAERSELQNTLRSLEQREFVFQLNGKTPYKCVADEIKTSKK